jgi:hypothetical protein
MDHIRPFPPDGLPQSKAEVGVRGLEAPGKAHHLHSVHFRGGAGRIVGADHPHVVTPRREPPRHLVDAGLHPAHEGGIAHDHLKDSHGRGSRTVARRNP